jgi:L-lactate dehydrogenase complex protein LldF
MEVATERMKASAKASLGDAQLRVALDRAIGAFVGNRRTALASLPTFEELRVQAADVKAHLLDHLDVYLDRLIDALEARGVAVHYAADAAEARAAVVAIARAAGARTAVKAKSMVTEEIGLNEALAAAGVTPIETDLGEYILQLGDDVPSHIVGPALHWTRERVAALFHRHLGTPLDADPTALTTAARHELRRAFLQADLGISGVNFACADTGTLVVVENEGNARLATSLPRVHVAVMGLEKLLPRLADLPTFLGLLARSATGQAATSYVSLLSGPRRHDEAEGPEAMHVVILDGGRSAVLADPELRAALRCIRCGACLNHCPVYGRIGGHAYGWVYGGPIGAILDPGLLGLERTHQLPQASSLCGACGDVCPVKIPIPDLLLTHRRRAVEQGLSPPAERAGIGAFAFVAERPGLWRAATAAGRFATALLERDGSVRGAWVPVLRDWLAERDLSLSTGPSFRERWQRELRHERPAAVAVPPLVTAPAAGEGGGA